MSRLGGQPVSCHLGGRHFRALGCRVPGLGSGQLGWPGPHIWALCPCIEYHSPAPQGLGEPHSVSTSAPPFSVMSWVVRSPARSLTPAARTARGFPSSPLSIPGVRRVPGAPPRGLCAVHLLHAGPVQALGCGVWGAEEPCEGRRWHTRPGRGQVARGQLGGPRKPQNPHLGGADSRLWGHLWLERGCHVQELEPYLGGRARTDRGCSGTSRMTLRCQGTQGGPAAGSGAADGGRVGADLPWGPAPRGSGWTLLCPFLLLFVLACSWI